MKPSKLKAKAKRKAKRLRRKLRKLAKKWRRQRARGKGKTLKQRRDARAEKWGTPGFYSWGAMIEIYGDRCALCGATGVPMTEGHIIPMSRRGSNWSWNIRPECAPCNHEKDNLLDEELSSSFWESRPGQTVWPPLEVGLVDL